MPDVVNPKSLLSHKAMQTCAYSPIFRVRRKIMSCMRELTASLKDDTARMNDRIILKQLTRQIYHQTADPNANASVLLFSTPHFLKSILDSSTNGTFGFARNTSRPFAKPKEPFFVNASKTIYSIILNS